MKGWLGTRGGLVAAMVSVVAASTAGCGISGLYGVPLPGGPDTGDDPYRVVAYFHDVLDLVPQSSVHVNDVGVGKIEQIELAEQGFVAKVTMRINGAVELPANAEAAVRQTSLLGEKFIELRAPAGQAPAGRLADGAEIPLERTDRSVEVEEVLGAFSMLINGGGIDQIQSIAQELNEALDGNEPQVKALLSDLDSFVGGLDTQKSEIVRAIEGLNKLSETLNGQSAKLEIALDELPAGLAVLNEQRGQLVAMLQALEELSGVATDVINRSRDDVLADLRALQPILTELVTAGDNLPKSLELLLTFPFPDGAVPAMQGDYANLNLKVDLDLRNVLDNLGDSEQPLLPLPELPGDQPEQPGLPIPGLPELPVPGLPELPGLLPGEQQTTSGGNIFDELFGLLGGQS